ncbi:MAG: hypothetical protein JWN30_2186 [Bacilli bacterium]|nr:hypothetical protein [Bacilli bacterium]
MKFFKRWSIAAVKKRTLAVERVKDVLYESRKDGQYLVHVFVDGLTERLEAILQPKIKKAVGRLPKGVTVDVLLYRKQAS